MGSLRGPNPHSASETELISIPKDTSQVPAGFCPKSHTPRWLGLCRIWTCPCGVPRHVRQPLVVHHVGRLDRIPGGRGPHFTLPPIFHQPGGLPCGHMPEPLAQVVVRSAAFERNIHTRTHKHRHTHRMPDPQPAVAPWKQRAQPQQGCSPHKGAEPCTFHPTQPPSQPIQSVDPGGHHQGPLTKFSEPKLEPFQATCSSHCATRQDPHRHG